MIYIYIYIYIFPFDYDLILSNTKQDYMENKIKLIEENDENNDMKIFGNTMDGKTVTYTIGWYCESIEKCKKKF